LILLRLAEPLIPMSTSHSSASRSTSPRGLLYRQMMHSLLEATGGNGHETAGWAHFLGRSHQLVTDPDHETPQTGLRPADILADTASQWRIRQEAGPGWA
ncbi:MAG: hypothetical protein ACRDHD_09305, partial [Candidatus Limnocylindria bacterium]